ncbi:hypothetical protein GCM10009104_34660 [Marinobacterium maritimum]|uniref:LysM domain-containing protein n=1 Tax=Marinobacterium maritimum TaxID=500162 RepID=A0ABP3TJL8_9GAMM
MAGQTLASQATATHSYTIQKDECLSLLAKRFGTTVDALQRLNSDQIKNIHLIYAGRQIKTPAPPEQAPSAKQADDIETIEAIEPDTDTKRTPVPDYRQQGKTANGNTTCSEAEVTYADVLYVAQHPKSNRPEWYAFTQEALDSLRLERSHLASAIQQDDLDTTHHNLTRLGILSKLAGKSFEAFLSEEDAKHYQDLLFKQTVLKSSAEQFYQDGPESFVYKLLQENPVNLREEIQEQIDLDIANELCAIDYNKFNPLRSPSLQLEAWISEAELGREIRQYQTLISFREKTKRDAYEAGYKKLVSYYEDQIKILEEKAIKAAPGKISDDGSRFVFDRNRNYFTSRKEKQIEHGIKQLKRCRDKCYSRKELMFEEPAESHQNLKEFWDKELPFAHQRLMAGRVYRYHPTRFVRYLKKVNGFGFALIDQCLPYEKLIGTTESHYGPKEFGKEWRDKEGPLFDDRNKLSNQSQVFKSIYTRMNPEGKDGQGYIEQILDDIKTGTQWAYYPTCAILATIEAILEEQQAGLSALLDGQLPPGFFQHILWVKKLALSRLDRLEKLAERNAREGKLEPGRCWLEQPLTTYTLLREDTPYIPKEKSYGAFLNKAGKADLQVVECSLLSEGKVFYIRSAEWFMPEKDNKEIACLGHVKHITTSMNIQQVVSRKEHTKTARAAIFAALNNLEIKGLSAELVKTPSASASYDSCFWHGNLHTQWGLTDTGTSAYVVDAEAQSMRFSAKAESSLDLPFNAVNPISLKKALKAGGSVSMSLTLLSGQLSFACWLPLVEGNQNYTSHEVSKVNGHTFLIPYYKFSDGVRSKVDYNAGKLLAYVSASVYGLAGVSCNLGASLELGPSEIDGSIGLKGRAISRSNHPNRYIDSEAIEVDQKLPTAAQAGAHTDVFAGVEAGGTVGADIYWRPLDHEQEKYLDPMKLGCFSAHAAVNYGLRGSAEFKIALHNGRLLLIAAAGGTLGLGFHGKVAIEIDAMAADRFLACVLGVFNQSGFQKLAFLGEEPGEFESLNTLLTIAVAAGLTIGQAILLPVVTYERYKISVMRNEYAPVLALNIIQENSKGITSSWVQSLPPETLAKLISILISKQNTRTENKIKISYDNKNRLDSLMKIFSWIVNNPKNLKNKENSRKQFEQTLFIMGNNNRNKNIGYITKWESFCTNWWKIADFIKKTIDMEYISEPDKAFSIISIFNEKSKELCSNIACYECSIVSSNHFGTSILKHYIAYDKNPQRHKNIRKQEDIKSAIKHQKMIIQKLSRSNPKDKELSKPSEFKWELA